MKFQKLALVLVVNLAIALGFYFDGLSADVTDLSSDLANIIPICKKLDNPEWYRDDLYLSDSNDVKYYTPAYVQTLRFFAGFTHGDYLQALNLLNLFVHFAYGMLWFLLFYALGRDFWLALVFSIFFRGVLWPPGGELLGISDFWTAMPRTVYTAFLPLPFLIFNRWRSAAGLLISALVLGLLLNLHPISGVGGILIYFSAFIAWNWLTRTKDPKNFILLLSASTVCCFIGILPYLLTYFGSVKVGAQLDQGLFDLAFQKRLGTVFSDPMQLLRAWNRPIAYFFGLFFLAFYFVDRSPRKRRFKILATAFVVVLLTANASVYIEKVVNSVFDKNLRMSFQLIRYQKYLLVIAQIAMYLFLAEMVQKWAIREKHKIIAAVIFAILLSVSTVPALRNVPFLSDDLMTSVLPSPMKIYKKTKPKNKRDRAAMIDYIGKNTAADAVFFGSYMIRAGANRSVVLDRKGAGMLIEGNRSKFIDWYLQTEKFESLDESGKIKFLEAMHVDYAMVEEEWSSLHPQKKIGKFYLYKL